MIQKKRLPTRKIIAVVLAGMIIGGIQGLLSIFWPDHPFAPYEEDFSIWLQGLIMILVGYFTKDRNNVPLETNARVEEPAGSDGDQLVLDLVQPSKEE